MSEQADERRRPPTLPLRLRSIFGYLDAIAAFANSRRLLSIGSREWVQAGGIIGYGIDYPAAFRRAAIFVDKILKGGKPGDIPIEQATKFEIVLNLKAAKTLGFEVPTPILLRADEVIE